MADAQPLVRSGQGQRARQESSVLTLVLVNAAWSQMDASPLPQFLQKKRKEREENEGAEKGQKYLD